MEGIRFYDPLKENAFGIYGLCKSDLEKGQFRRIPDEVAKTVNDGVRFHGANTAGGRIRFKTNSEIVVLKVKTGKKSQMYHATPLMESGFDLYVDGIFESKFAGIVKPDFEKRDEYESEIRLGKGEKEITLYLPLYGNVYSIEIGLTEGASLYAHRPYKYSVPIVYYGSSITQGGCATRPGKTYQSIIARRTDSDYINLGFSGSARGEKEIAEYLSGLDMSVFVCDYDHNASQDVLRETHYALYETIRKNHPDIPYLMVTKPDFNYSRDDFQRRAIIMESYLKAFGNGDRQVYFVDGSTFFTGTEIGQCTVDGVHPTDDGFERMAKFIGEVIIKNADWEKMK